MNTKFQVRTWLWWMLAIVVVAGLGFTGWYYNYKVKPSKTASSPTPSSSAAIPPTAGTNTTPSSGKTSTPSGGQQTPTVETETYEIKLASAGAPVLNCIPTVAFQYPKDWHIGIIGGTPSAGGWMKLDINSQAGQDTGGDIYIEAVSYKTSFSYQPITCVDPQYENLTDFASRNNISNYTPTTVGGSSAIQYSENQYVKNTAIQNTDKNIVKISLKDNSGLDAYNIIINSFKFK